MATPKIQIGCQPEALIKTPPSLVLRYGAGRRVPLKTWKQITHNLTSRSSGWRKAATA